jgi:cytochrome c oxidase accessory protein FixG
VLHARPVTGTWRRLRTGANGVLVAILFGVPWIRIAGEPLVLLDVPARKFHVFGLVIFPQELYFLWLILAALALSLFFFTALAGRLWCGWACPQTVFTDVFAGVARRIQGWRGSRPPARLATWRRVATHLVWLLLAWVIGFHLVAYFRSPYDLLGTLFREGRVYPTTFAFHVAIALVTYLDFAIVRQTFCKYLCPYARFQGVLFDPDTLVIGYDARRGEPRGKKGRVTGDCVDCRLCVEVCPSGIDIRHGLQLECIACTQCIDACNGVMARLGRARNLIGYRSLVGLEGLRPVRWLRPRVVVYGVLLACVTGVFAAALGRRLPMELHVAHNRAQLYTTTASGAVGNSYILHIENRARADRSFHLRLQEAPYELVAGLNPIPVPATSAVQASVFVLAKEARPAPSSEIHFVLEPVEDGGAAIVRPTRFLAPVAGSGGTPRGG